MSNPSFNRVVPQSSCALPAKGYWFPPIPQSGTHRVASEEIFGPVLSLPFSSASL